MIEKLQEVENRFEEVNELVCNPDIVSDQEKYTKLMRELKHLTPVVEKFREYKKAKQTEEESRAMLDEGGMDADFAQMVKEEFEQSREDMERIEEELKVLLFARIWDGINSSLALLFTSNRRLFIMFSLANFLDDTITRSLTLESSECAVKRFVFFNFYLAHFIPSLRPLRGYLILLFEYLHKIIYKNISLVKYFVNKFINICKIVNDY